MRRLFFARPQLVVVLLTVLWLVPYVVVSVYPAPVMTSKVTMLVRRPFLFPNGGRTLWPSYRLVALYGTPGVPELGALGEQDISGSINRVKGIAAAYQPLVTEHVYPTFEIIATVASASPTDDGDYSYPVSADGLQQWIAAAQANGVYVVLDMQPGRADFLTQARSLEPLLLQPNVGLALDPEWRLKPKELPLVQIGSVDITEVNQTAAWLAALTKLHHLPQKLFLLHQFRLDMIGNRELLDTSHPELAYAVQMDGQGTQAAKLGTWQALTAAIPSNVNMGWKNFYKKDTEPRTPEATMQVVPQPWYVSYQ